MIFMCAFVVSISTAKVVSWNWDVYSTINPSDYAGVIPVKNWNDSYLQGTYPDGPNGNLEQHDLTDNTGVATTMDIRWSYNTSCNAWGWSMGQHPGYDEDGTANKEMLNGYLDGFGSDLSVIKLSRIPYRKYDIYVYFCSDGAGRTGKVGIGKTAYYFNAYGPSSIISGNALLSKTTNTREGDYSTVANYAVFSGLRGECQTITVTPTDQGIGIAAIQVVDANTPLPRHPADFRSKRSGDGSVSVQDLFGWDSPQ